MKTISKALAPVIALTMLGGASLPAMADTGSATQAPQKVSIYTIDNAATSTDAPTTEPLAPVNSRVDAEIAAENLADAADADAITADAEIAADSILNQLDKKVDEKTKAADAAAEKKAAAQAAAEAKAAAKAEAERIAAEKAAAKKAAAEKKAAEARASAEAKKAAAAKRAAAEKKSASAASATVGVQSAAAVAPIEIAPVAAAATGFAPAANYTNAGVQSNGNLYGVAAPQAKENATPAPQSAVNVTPQSKPASTASSSTNQKIYAAAMAQLGKNQDCTMLVTNALKSVGINFRDWPAGYKKLGTVVPASQAQPGDLIYYKDGGMGLAHIAVYAGGGKAIHGGWNGNDTVINSANVGSGAEYIRVNG